MQVFLQMTLLLPSDDKIYNFLVNDINETDTLPKKGGAVNA